MARGTGASLPKVDASCGYPPVSNLSITDEGTSQRHGIAFVKVRITACNNRVGSRWRVGSATEDLCRPSQSKETFSSANLR